MAGARAGGAASHWQTPMSTNAGNRVSSAFTRGHSPDAALPAPRASPKNDKPGLSIGGRQTEIECRSRPRRRVQPHSAAMPLDGFLAKRESKSVPGVFPPVQALKHPEDAFVECRLYAGTVVLYGEYPIEIHSFA